MAMIVATETAREIAHIAAFGLSPLPCSEAHVH